MTLKRDLKLEFDTAREVFAAELQLHVSLGGRLSSTTDAWSARNYKQYAAVTVHWTDGFWQLRSSVLDVVHLAQPIHSGDYLTELLFGVT